MLLKDNKKGLVTLIMKRMKGTDDMSPSYTKESEQMQKAPQPEGAELDNEMGYDSCCDGMIEAFKAGDSQKLKRSLKSFFKMMMSEQDDDDY